MPKLNFNGPIITGLLASLTGCGGPNDITGEISRSSSSEKAIAAIGTDNADVAPPSSPVPTIDANKAASICKAGIAELFGRYPDTMKAEQQSDGIVRISYRRPEDGTLWKNDCRLEGNRIMWRAVDVSPGSGPGRWRNDPADEVLTYTMDGDKIRINMSY